MEVEDDEVVAETKEDTEPLLLILEALREECGVKNVPLPSGHTLWSEVTVKCSGSSATRINMLKLVPAMYTSQVHKQIQKLFFFKSQSLENHHVWQVVTSVVLHKS